MNSNFDFDNEEFIQSSSNDNKDKLKGSFKLSSKYLNEIVISNNRRSGTFPSHKVFIISQLTKELIYIYSIPLNEGQRCRAYRE